MKAYIVTTGAAFGLLTLAHIARMFEEGAHLITQPSFSTYDSWISKRLHVGNNPS